jgi:isoleucyl-tRNA synthetase
MPWCARCGTGISQHEIVTDGYFEVTHDSVFVKFPITKKSDFSQKSASRRRQVRKRCWSGPLRPGR